MSFYLLVARDADARPLAMEPVSASCLELVATTALHWLLTTSTAAWADVCIYMVGQRPLSPALEAVAPLACAPVALIVLPPRETSPPVTARAACLN